MWNNQGKAYSVVVSAPSGAGKTSLCQKLLKNHNDKITFSRSCTTRPQRNNESSDSYYFLSESDFLQKINNNEFIEWAEVHGKYYGTLKKTVDKEIEREKIVLLDIDVQGGIQVKKKLPETLMIFILPPSISVLEERLKNRKSETEIQLQLRMKNAADEIQFLTHYDYLIINNDFQQAYQEFEMIIQAYSYRKINYQTTFLNSWINKEL